MYVLNYKIRRTFPHLFRLVICCWAFQNLNSKLAMFLVLILGKNFFLFTSPLAKVYCFISLCFFIQLFNFFLDTMSLNIPSKTYLKLVRGIFAMNKFSDPQTQQSYFTELASPVIVSLYSFNYR